MNVLISGGPWNSVLRITTFWAIAAACIVALGFMWPAFDIRLIADVLSKAFGGEMEGLSTQSFAFALASALIAVGAGLAVAFMLLYAVAISLALWSVRRVVAGSRDMVTFAGDYEVVYKQLARHPLIGHAWKEFDETLVMPKEPGGVIRNTVRPQAFINMGVARDRLFGLKMMGSIPGYFVGIGLLLTFGGLVLALDKAAAATTSIDANSMQIATRELLQVATFKFSTSIAGLGTSILLSFLFRIYTIAVEGSFDKFCQMVERKLRYAAPQSITAEMNDHMAEQVNELKQINSAEFFARMGDAVSPKIQSAFSTAFAPVTSSIDQAINRLADNSQEGMSELIARFTAGSRPSRWWRILGSQLRALVRLPG